MFSVWPPKLKVTFGEGFLGSIRISGRADPDFTACCPFFVHDNQGRAFPSGKTECPSWLPICNHSDASPIGPHPQANLVFGIFVHQGDRWIPFVKPEGYGLGPSFVREDYSPSVKHFRGGWCAFTETLCFTFLVADLGATKAL
jgi:hypothetical protein